MISWIPEICFIVFLYICFCEESTRSQVLIFIVSFVIQMIWILFSIKKDEYSWLSIRGIITALLFCNTLYQLTQTLIFSTSFLLTQK